MTLPPFVTHPTQVLENAIQFQRDLLSNKNLAALLSSFVSWYAFKQPQGEIIFVPSKFGGYQNMNASTYLQINQLTNGRETEAVLSRWFERPSVLEEQALLAELANHLSKFGKAVNKRARVSTLSGRTITSAVEGTAQSSPLVMALKTIYDKLEEAEKVEFLRLVRESSISDEEK